MSELKAYRVKGVTLGDTHDVYLKSEADKVIKELEKKLDLYKKGWEESDRLNASIYAELKETLNNSRNARKYWRKEYLIEYKECSYQKYKRCLAMATACHEQVKYYKVEYDADEGFGDNWLKWIRWAKKWKTRWLKLAEKFKEAK